MTETVVIPVPDTFIAVVRGQDTPIKNKHTGRVTVPSSWTGADWQEFHEATTKAADDDVIWQRQWQWAKKRIVEWDLKDLPTNPNQIEDGDLPWALVAFLAQGVHAKMDAYLEEHREERKAELDYPEIDSLSAAEFFAWNTNAKTLPDGDETSDLLKSWLAGRILVRGWANGSVPDKDGLSVDLALIGAIDEILSEVILPAIDLGNSPARHGPRSTSKS